MPSSTNDAADNAESTKASGHKARVIRDALAAVKKQMQKIVDAEAGDKGEAVAGWIIRNGKGELQAYGHPAFIQALRNSNLGQHLEEELESYPTPPPLSSGPFLPTLPRDWKKKSPWGGDGLRAVFHRTYSAILPNVRPSYKVRPEWWPARLLFSSPTGPPALGLKTTAEFKAALVELIESAYSHYSQPAGSQPSSPMSSTSEVSARVSSPGLIQSILEDSRTPMGLSRPSQPVAPLQPLPVFNISTGQEDDVRALVSSEPALAMSSVSESLIQDIPRALASSGPALVIPSISEAVVREPSSALASSKPVPAKSSISTRPLALASSEPAIAPRMTRRRALKSGAVAAPASSVPLDNSGHVVTDDLVLRIIRVVRSATGDAVSANFPPASLYTLHDREEAPFLRLPHTTSAAAQIHHMGAPEHWLTSGLVNGEVCVWDTVKLGQTAALRREVAGIYAEVSGDSDGAVHVQHFYPILQSGGSVCGFLACAFLIDYSLGLVPHRRLYKQEEAKATVIRVLNSGQLETCSKPLTSAAEARVRAGSEYLTSVHCCGSTGGGELMVECESCGRWWHVRASCLSFLPAPDRALFIRSTQHLIRDRNASSPPLICCASSSPTPSSQSVSSSHDIFQDY